MQLIVEGIGTDAGVSQVVFELTSFSTYDGYDENTSDPAVEGTDKDKDFSFAEDVNQSLFVLSPGMTYAQDGGEIESMKVRQSIWAKDYGGSATVDVTLQIGAIRAVLQKLVPKDNDNDMLPDVWELKKVTEWNAQYGTSETGLGLFSGKVTDLMDSELPDADGMNTDGGRNLPAHQNAGDRLFVFQEYRGFTLDGGGFAPDGTGGHPAGKHTSLSPVHKELLVEVDSMEFKADGATTGFEHGSNSMIDTILAKASKGFSDKDKGAGVYMYWVRSEKGVKYKTFGTKEKALDEMLARRKNPKHPKLKRDFVHLMFFGNSPKSVTNESGVWTDDDHAKQDKQGSVIFLDRVHATFTAKDADDYPFIPTVSSATVHEVTHLLLFPDSTPSLDDGWLSDEHPIVDKKFVMYKEFNPENSQTIWFSDQTIGEIDGSSGSCVRRQSMRRNSLYSNEVSGSPVHPRRRIGLTLAGPMRRRG